MSGSNPPPPPGAPWTTYPPPPSYAPSPYGPSPTTTPEKPTAATVLSIIGGVFILLGGLAEIRIGAYLASITFPFAGGGLVVFGVVGLILGLLILIFGVMLSNHPESHSTYGTLIVVLAVISLTSFGGGFVIGFLLALIGGILALTWKPTPVLPPPYSPTYPPTYPPIAAPVPRQCPRCRRAADPSVRYCSQCGSPIP